MIRYARSLALGAVVASGAVHFGAMAVVMRDPPIQIEGGEVASAARLGNSFQDVVNGTPEPVEPKETLAEKVEEKTEAVDPDVLKPTEPDQEPAKPVLDKVELTPQKPVEALQAQPTVLKPTEPAAKPQETVTATAQPVQALPLEAPAVETLTPDVPLAAAEVVESDMAKIQPVDDPAPMVSQRPTARPKTVEAKAAAAKPKAQPKPKPKAQAQAKPKPKPKPKGTAQPAQAKGKVDGQKAAKNSEATTKKGNASKAGNAAASNYPGKVMRKISRQRRPKGRARGAVRIAFKIGSNGGLSSIGVARSSGNADLDQAALNLVRRTAPFPAPPAGAQRSFAIEIKGR